MITLSGDTVKVNTLLQDIAQVHGVRVVIAETAAELTDDRELARIAEWLSPADQHALAEGSADLGARFTLDAFGPLELDTKPSAATDEEDLPF